MIEFYVVLVITPVFIIQLHDDYHYLTTLSSSS